MTPAIGTTVFRDVLVAPAGQHPQTHRWDWGPLIENVVAAPVGSWFLAKPPEHMRAPWMRSPHLYRAIVAKRLHTALGPGFVSTTPGLYGCFIGRISPTTKGAKAS